MNKHPAKQTVRKYSKAQKFSMFVTRNIQPQTIVVANIEPDTLNALASEQENDKQTRYDKHIQ